MGAGKTTVGMVVAERLGWTFVDLDDLTEELAGMPIPSIFDAQGEGGFRDLEHRALSVQADRSATGTSAVVALGGGTYACERNRLLLRQLGITLWLAADADLLWNRVRGASHRPLAQDESAFRSLHSERIPSYSRADYRIDASGTAAEVADRIVGQSWMKAWVSDG